VLSGLTRRTSAKLVQDAKEGDVYDLLKALQHGCAPGTPKGTALCLSLAEVLPTIGRTLRERIVLRVLWPCLTKKFAHKIWMCRCAFASQLQLRVVVAERFSIFCLTRLCFLALHVGLLAVGQLTNLLGALAPCFVTAASSHAQLLVSTETGSVEHTRLAGADAEYRQCRDGLSLVCVQADMLGANDCATIVMAILEGISSAHENLAKLLELLPKLLLTVCPHLLETLLVHHLLLLPSAVPWPLYSHSLYGFDLAKCSVPKCACADCQNMPPAPIWALECPALGAL